LIRFAGIKVALENITGDAACFPALHVSTFIPYLSFEVVCSRMIRATRWTLQDSPASLMSL
jgi:hypothetical protein